MSKGISKAQADKLGERLRKSETPTEEDLVLLEEFRSLYDAPMAIVETVLRDRLGLSPTSRLKTTQTIIDKLRREHTRLSSIQDIAGVRIVKNMFLDEQDVLVQEVVGEFVDPKSKVIDRRNQPSHGYRAVHVVSKVEGRPVEIQLRTEIQDLWAQIVEWLADLWGRGIRYGEDPDSDLIVGTKGDGSSVSRKEFVARFLKFSEEIAQLEVLRSAFHRGDVAAAMSLVEPTAQGDLARLQRSNADSLSKHPDFLKAVELADQHHRTLTSTMKRMVENIEQSAHREGESK